MSEARTGEETALAQGRLGGSAARSGERALLQSIESGRYGLVLDLGGLDHIGETGTFEEPAARGGAFARLARHAHSFRRRLA